MPKTEWERRVGMLLDPEKHDDFVWSYKPHDSALYGGQPRLDWLACDRVGRFWVIEVKTAGKGRKSITLERELSPGQITALDAVAASKFGVALLAVGHETTLHVFDWRKIGWALRVAQASGSVTMIGFDQAAFSFLWTGPKSWTRDLYGEYTSLLTTHMPVGPFPMPPMPMPSGSPSLDPPPAPSPSTLRPSSKRQRMRKLLAMIPSPDG